MLITQKTAFDLSFVKLMQTKPRTLNTWDPKRTGNWQVDCAHGRDCADELIAKMRKIKDPTILGRILQAMIGHAQFTGVEVGFAQRLAELSMA